MDGSSKIYTTPFKESPSWVASRILCASPPDKLVADLSSVRYERPTSARYFKRNCISLITGSETFFSFKERAFLLFCENILKKLFAFPIFIAVTSAMLFSKIVTDKDSLRKRFPWHSGHTDTRIYWVISCRK